MPATTPNPPDGMDPLQRLVRRRLEETDLSLRQAVAKSHGLFSYATIARISAGSHRGRMVTDATIAGLSLVLKISEDELRAAAEESAAPADLERWLKEVPRLDDDLQRRVLDTVRLAVEEQGDRNRKASRLRGPRRQP